MFERDIPIVFMKVSEKREWDYYYKEEYFPTMHGFEMNK